jgi:hypothetical protein
MAQPKATKDMTFFLDDESYFKALSLLEIRKKTSPELVIATDKGIISMRAGASPVVYLDDVPSGTICFNLYGEEEHSFTSSLYLPITPTEPGAKPITWTLKRM